MLHIPIALDTFFKGKILFKNLELIYKKHIYVSSRRDFAKIPLPWT